MKSFGHTEMCNIFVTSTHFQGVSTKRSLILILGRVYTDPTREIICVKRKGNPGKSCFSRAISLNGTRGSHTEWQISMMTYHQGVHALRLWSEVLTLNNFKKGYKALPSPKQNVRRRVPVTENAPWGITIPVSRRHIMIKRLTLV